MSTQLAVSDSVCVLRRRSAPALLTRNRWGVMANRFCTCGPSTVKENRMGRLSSRMKPGSSGANVLGL